MGWLQGARPWGHEHEEDSTVGPVSGSCSWRGVEGGVGPRCTQLLWECRGRGLSAARGHSKV